MISKTFLAAALLIASTALVPAKVSAQNTKHAPVDMPAEILHLINEHRAGMKLGALKMNSVISNAAEKHSRNMATKKIPFGHDGFDARMANVSHQLKGATGWAENVAYGPTTAKDVVDMWLHSPGHKKNIEGNYNLTGIGIVKGSNGEPYYTQIFMNKEK